MSKGDVRQTSIPETKVIHGRVEYDFINGRYKFRGAGPDPSTDPIVDVPLTEDQAKLFRKMLGYKP